MTLLVEKSVLQAEKQASLISEAFSEQKERRSAEELVSYAVGKEIINEAEIIDVDSRKNNSSLQLPPATFLQSDKKTYTVIDSAGGIFNLWFRFDEKKFIRMKLPLAGMKNDMLILVAKGAILAAVLLLLQYSGYLIFVRYILNPVGAASAFTRSGGAAPAEVRGVLELTGIISAFRKNEKNLNRSRAENSAFRIQIENYREEKAAETKLVDSMSLPEKEGRVQNLFWYAGSARNQFREFVKLKSGRILFMNIVFTEESAALLLKTIKLKENIESALKGFEGYDVILPHIKAYLHRTGTAVQSFSAGIINRKGHIQYQCINARIYLMTEEKKKFYTLKLNESNNTYFETAMQPGDRMVVLDSSKETAVELLNSTFNAGVDLKEWFRIEPSVPALAFEISRVLSEEDGLIAEGKKLFNDRQYAAAVKKFNRVLEIDGVNRTALLYAGNCMLYLQFFSEAVSYFETYIEKNKTNAHAWERYGFALQKAGETDGAVKAYRSALNLKPSLLMPHIQLSVLYHNSGDSERARRHLKKAEELRPEDQRLLLLKKRLLSANEQVKQNEKAS